MLGYAQRICAQVEQAYPTLLNDPMYQAHAVMFQQYAREFGVYVSEVDAGTREAADVPSGVGFVYAEQAYRAYVQGAVA